MYRRSICNRFEIIASLFETATRRRESHNQNLSTFIHSMRVAGNSEGFKNLYKRDRDRDASL